MDFKFAASTEKALPPIPIRHGSRPSPDSEHHNCHQPQNPRRRSPQPSTCTSIPPASPDIISTLITSLGAIPQPTDSYFEPHSATFNFGLPSPSTPYTGSFGVDFGAYARPDSQESSQLPTSLNDLAASPPIVRTSKPTSGYSPLVGAKSLQARSPSCDSGAGFHSFIHSNNINSQPSSPGSVTSKNDDTRSIGNLSVERGSGATPGLKHRPSHDSWGKNSRNTNGLVYLSPKELLQERELDRKRLPRSAGSSFDSIGGGGRGVVGPSNMSNGIRSDPLPAETAISEEVASHIDDPRPNNQTMPGCPQSIPVRGSSLRKPRRQPRKRSGARRQRRESVIPAGDVILETEEKSLESESSPSLPTMRWKHSRSGSDAPAQGLSFLLGPDERPTSPVPASPKPTRGAHDIAIISIDLDDDGAPFPAVSQCRQEERSVERNRHRLSGRLSPGPKEAFRLGRSNSRLKRLSGQLGPRCDSRASPGPSLPESSQSQNFFSTSHERPPSADPIDDAVESYLSSPRLSHKVRHPQTGRVISFSEVGDAKGSAVFCCVGMGLTRYITAFYDELALTLKLRLITPDRPGVGGSDPYTDGSTTPLSWPDDVYAICQALKITKFSILAHSAGAIYALATALRMPQHIRGRIHLLAPWIPPSQMNVFGGSQTLPPTNAIPTSQKILRALPTPLLKAANSSFMTATSSSITSSLPKNPRRTKRKSNTHGSKDDTHATNRNVTPSQEQENIGSNKPERQHSSDSEEGLASPKTSHMDQVPLQGANGPSGSTSVADAVGDPMVDRERRLTYDTRLTHAIWELATTGANPAVDLLVCLERRHPIGFRYVDITRPVVIHHGSRDTRVPVENVKWLGKTMRRCEVRVLEGEGHGLMASATVMGSVLMEMSKEWDDWMRVTGADGRKDRERGRRGTLGRG
ncbi:uncharacterized protein UV8b_00005 [Ustilaginoidea virens]|uniref:AB hydrolase-1 domain-containing protein n=1 Tax=Ustilaginoidea virens TaxID=1159556 RepID=A0A8E5HIX2_USTVR|nr:uncharacterized protein UV8b_00005 [Ustilaginoidea virens]QUC15764.1 hypothetical protein UV8b_00005 [Ustilaginoidea virens]